MHLPRRTRKNYARRTSRLAKGLATRRPSSVQRQLEELESRDMLTSVPLTIDITGVGVIGVGTANSFAGLTIDFRQHGQQQRGLRNRPAGR